MIEQAVHRLSRRVTYFIVYRFVIRLCEKDANYIDLLIFPIGEIKAKPTLAAVIIRVTIKFKIGAQIAYGFVCVFEHSGG